MNDSKIKLDASKSRFAKKSESEKVVKDQFENEVSEHQKNQTIMTNKIAELAKQFSSLIDDSTLNENKGPIQLEVEKSLPKQIADMAIELNNDETQPEGIGSIGCVLLLLKCMLKQRDIINKLRYEISLCKKEESSQSDSYGK